MSAPDTDIEKQKRRHWGPLVGVGVLVVAVGTLFLVFTGYLAEPAADDGDLGGTATTTESDS